MQKRILIVEDQLDIQQLVKMTLASDGYHVATAADGINGCQMARDDQYDAIVLDLMLPGMDGLQICQELRRNHIHTPILMLTAKKTEADRVVGLEMGADDYLTKPFSVRELQARVKALLRRVAFMQEAECSDTTLVTVEDLVIDRQRRQVKLKEKDVVLTAKEFDLLNYLASMPGKVFTREQLLSSVWGYQYNGYEHTVNSHINRLRSKIEQNPAQPNYVLTVWGVGYKFRD